MSKVLYLVRHCQSVGHHPEAPLSGDGLAQADALAERLTRLGIERIVSSPFRRAMQSVAPLARRLGLAVDIEPRLREHVLSAADLPDWRAALKASFEDPDLCFEGGESGRAATQRVLSAVEEMRARAAPITAVATHGKLLTFLLRHFDSRIGFADWQALTNPDIFRLTFACDRANVRRFR
jgi:2,3-bisphosphoglycerate-dependent phosphoglycerate mutase